MTSDSPISSRDVAGQPDLDTDKPLRLHPLVYLADGDEVTIGRQDIDTYGIFPADGAELVRKLAAGDTPRQVADWFAQTYGEAVDIEEIISGLSELDFLVRPDEEASSTTQPVRFARLGAAVFSPIAWTVYAVIVVMALIVMVDHPDLLPSYHRVFFTSYYSVIPVALFFSAIPLLLLHESFHALAGRRLGLRSRLSIGRRLYFIVLETSLDGLVAVPRRKRYLPILAGLLADVLSVSVCVLLAEVSRSSDGSLPLVGRLLLAVAFAAVLRILWQFFFYLRTDIYVLISTVLGCVDLHSAAKQVVANRVYQALGQPHKVVDLSRLHPVDRRATRWYSWLVVIGYGVSLTTVLSAGLPVLWRMATGVLSRFRAADVPASQLLDSALFSAAVVLQVVALTVLAVRDRRQRRAVPEFRSVIH